MKIINKKSKRSCPKTLCIVTGIHGNEAHLFKPLSNFILSLKDLPVNIKIILANEEAAKKNVRYLESDLNRVFNKNKKNHEGRLSKKILEECDGNLIIDLHTHQNKEKFGLIPKESFNNLKGYADYLGFENCIVLSNKITGKGSFIENVKNGLSIETGQHCSKESIDFAKYCIKKAIDFLSSDVIYKNKTRYIEGVKFMANNGCFKIIINSKIKNFEKVFAGQKITKKITAKEDFIPTLVSRVVPPGKKILMICKEMGIENGVISKEEGGKFRYDGNFNLRKAFLHQFDNITKRLMKKSKDKQ